MNIDAQIKQGTVCAVIVTFYPDAETLRITLRSLESQVNSAVIVDNTPQHDAVDFTALVVQPEAPELHIIRLGENQGIAAAQNIGITWAQARNNKYVLLLDQDSIPETSMVKRLVESANELLAQGLPLAAIGPRYVDPRSGRSSSALRIGAVSLQRAQCNKTLSEETIRCDTLISSGSLIRLDVIKLIGDFDSSLFIDHVDNEWFLRARQNGYMTFLACGIVLQHKLGERIVRYWFGHWRSFPAHPPMRHYYMLRNTILLAHRPYVPRAWLLGTFSELLPILAAALLLLPQRGKRLWLILRAIYDGVLNRNGSRGI